MSAKISVTNHRSSRCSTMQQGRRRRGRTNIPMQCALLACVLLFQLQQSNAATKNTAAVYDDPEQLQLNDGGIDSSSSNHNNNSNNDDNRDYAFYHLVQSYNDDNNNHNYNKNNNQHISAMMTTTEEPLPQKATDGRLNATDMKAFSIEETDAEREALKVEKVKVEEEEEAEYATNIPNSDYSAAINPSNIGAVTEILELDRSGDDVNIDATTITGDYVRRQPKAEFYRPPAAGTAATTTDTDASALLMMNYDADDNEDERMPLAMKYYQAVGADENGENNLNHAHATHHHQQQHEPSSLLRQEQQLLYKQQLTPQIYAEYEEAVKRQQSAAEQTLKAATTAPLMHGTSATNNSTAHNYRTNNLVKIGIPSFMLPWIATATTAPTVPLLLPEYAATTAATKTMAAETLFPTERNAATIMTAAATSAATIRTTKTITATEAAPIIAGARPIAGSSSNKKQGKQIIISRRKLLPQEQLRNFIEDAYIRMPLAVIVDPSRDSLEKTKTLWRDALRTNLNIKIVLVALNASGIPAAFSFNNTHQFLAGLSSIKENDGGNSFIGIVHASELVPYDSAVFISTALIPTHTELVKDAAITLLKKRIRLYLIWYGERSESENETQEAVGGILGEVALRSGGEVLHIVDNESLQEFESNTPTLLADAFRGSQDIEIPVETTLSSLHIKVDSPMRKATLETPNGG